MHTWQIQDAENNFGELIDKAVHQGAQQIIRHGKKVAVVLANKEYESRYKSKYKNTYKQEDAAKDDLIFTLLNAPRGEELDIERSKEMVRELEL